MKYLQELFISQKRLQYLAHIYYTLQAAANWATIIHMCRIGYGHVVNGKYSTVSLYLILG